MASIHYNLFDRVSRLTLKVPEGVSLEVGRQKVVAALLPKEVLDAYTAGIRPTLSDWIEMPAEEKVLWQQYYEEEQQADKAFQAALFGNIVLAKGFMHATDEKAKRMDALEAGMDMVGL